MSLPRHPIGLPISFVSGDQRLHRGKNFPSIVRLATSTNIARLKGMLIRDVAMLSDRRDPPDPPDGMSPATSDVDSRAAACVALIKYVEAAVSSAAGIYGQPPVSLVTLSNRDVLAVTTVVLAPRSLCLGDRIPEQLKSLIYEGICRCFPKLRLAATSARTFFTWVTKRNRDCFRRDRRSGITSERPSLDNEFIPRKKGKRKVGKQKPVPKRSRVKCSAGPIKVELERSILPVSRGFNGRYVVALLKSLYNGTALAPAPTMPLAPAEQAAGFAMFSKYVLGYVLDFLPIYAGRIMMHTRESPTIGAVDLVAVKTIADHAEFANRPHWYCNMAVPFQISRADAFQIYDRVAKGYTQGTFEIWRQLLFILDGSEMRRWRRRDRNELRKMLMKHSAVQEISKHNSSELAMPDKPCISRAQTSSTVPSISDRRHRCKMRAVKQLVSKQAQTIAAHVERFVLSLSPLFFLPLSRSLPTSTPAFHYFAHVLMCTCAHVLMCSRLCCCVCIGAML